MGFDVVAFEGSAVDTWLAQDHLYRSSESAQERVAAAQRLAWFGLWQTNAMRQVMSYIYATQATGRPLYLASFDVGCFRATAARTDSERQTAERTLAEIRDWFAVAANGIHPEIHGRALKLVAESPGGAVELCSIAPTRPFGAQSYQRVRDWLNAGNVIAIRNVLSGSHRIAVWAHHSHVHHNSTGQRIPSMGQHLLAALGDDLYTIGLFAGEGQHWPILTTSWI